VHGLFGKADALPQLTSSWDKRYLPLSTERFQPARQSLRVIYVLAPRVNESSAPRIEEASSREAVLELVRNTYMNWFLDSRQRAVEFDVLTRLAASLPVRRLVPHTDPGRIVQMCDLLLRDAEALTVAAQRGSMAFGQ
jgi:hypothetical protein